MVEPVFQRCKFREKGVNHGLSESTSGLLNFPSLDLLLNSYLLFLFIKAQGKTLIVQCVERYNYINISHI